MKLKMEVTRRAIGRRAFVIVKQMNLNGAVRSNFVPDRRRILETRIDKFQSGLVRGERLCSPAKWTEKARNQDEKKPKAQALRNFHNGCGQ